MVVVETEEALALLQTAEDLPMEKMEPVSHYFGMNTELEAVGSAVVVDVVLHNAPTVVGWGAQLVAAVESVLAQEELSAVERSDQTVWPAAANSVAFAELMTEFVVDVGLEQASIAAVSAILLVVGVHQAADICSEAGSTEAVGSSCEPSLAATALSKRRQDQKIENAIVQFITWPEQILFSTIMITCCI